MKRIHHLFQNLFERFASLFSPQLMLLAAILLAGGVLAPLPVSAQVVGSPGSIYFSSATFVDATRDLRASRMNDVITIIVNEAASAVAGGTTNTSRKTSAKSSIGALAGTVASGARLANPLDLTGTQQLQGTGTTSRNATLTTTVTALVTLVTPTGDLLVEGSKEIMVNSERQLITVRGVVRQADLTTSNTVLSTQLANLQLQVNGKGVVEDAVHRPNILYRILLGILPF
jgi:flagellar L-ring protein precursor FlgH